MEEYRDEAYPLVVAEAHAAFSPLRLHGPHMAPNLRAVLRFHGGIQRAEIVQTAPAQCLRIGLQRFLVHEQHILARVEVSVLAKREELPEQAHGGDTAVIPRKGSVLLCPQILHLLSVPEDIFRGAYHYLLIIFLGIPFTLLYNYLSSILRSLGDSRTPFLFLAFSAILNIFLDLFCIVVLKWGCAGAAAATITAQAISGILCLVFIGRKMNVLHLKKENRMVNITAVKELLAMGLPTGLQFSITAIGSMVMQSANNGLGSVCVSGFTAGMRIKQFAMCPFDAIATSASVFCSQNMGARQPERIKKGLRQGVAIATIYGLLIGLVLIFGGRTLSMIFVKKSAADVLDASGKYLRCLGYFFWSLGILNVSRMVTQGLGYSGRAVLSGVTEMLARTIVSLGFVGALGYTAICFADQAAWIAACCYIAPTCLHCVKKVTGILEGNGNR